MTERQTQCRLRGGRSAHGSSFASVRLGADPGDVRLRFLPLLAARVPGVAKPLADDESLVIVFPDVLNPLLGTSLPRVDPAAAFMFRNGNAFDLAPIDDPDAAVTAP